MNLDKLNRVCFTICVVCIILGAVLSLAMIWLEIEDEKFVWKAWFTIVVFLLAAALTLSISKTFSGWRKE